MRHIVITTPQGKMYLEPLVGSDVFITIDDAIFRSGNSAISDGTVVVFSENGVGGESRTCDSYMQG